MTAHRLYGDARSGNCYKAALALRITGRVFEWVETDVTRGETRTADFLALNPNGRVPLMQLPDGRYLAESNAMLLYLGEGTRLLPAGRYERALVYQWLFFEQYSHEPFIAVARFIVKIADRGKQEAERLATLRENGHAALGVMEKALADRPFFAGGAFTAADIALFAYTHVADEGGFDLGPYPGIVEWLDRVRAVDGFMDMDQACR